MYGCHPAQSAFEAWTAASQSCVAAAATVWLQSTSQMAAMCMGPGNAVSASAGAVQTVVDDLLAVSPGAQPDASSWYRPLPPSESLFARAFGDVSASSPSHAASGWPGSLLAAMPWHGPWTNLSWLSPTTSFPMWSDPRAAMAPPQALMLMAFPFGLAGGPIAEFWRGPWTSAWLEGSSRAMLPAPAAEVAEAMRNPEAAIPFVSYRSESGFAVSQIAYQATRIMAAVLPVPMALFGIGDLARPLFALEPSRY